MWGWTLESADQIVLLLSWKHFTGLLFLSSQSTLLNCADCVSQTCLPARVRLSFTVGCPSRNSAGERRDFPRVSLPLQQVAAAAAALTSPPAALSNLSTAALLPPACLLRELHSRQRSATRVSSPRTLCLLSSLSVLLYSSVQTETWGAGLLSLEVQVFAVCCHFLRGLSPELHWSPHLSCVSQCPSSKVLASADVPLPFCSHSPLGRVPPAVAHLLITFIFPSYLSYSQYLCNQSPEELHLLGLNYPLWFLFVSKEGFFHFLE